MYWEVDYGPDDSSNDVYYIEDGSPWSFHGQEWG